MKYLPVLVSFSFAVLATSCTQSCCESEAVVKETYVHRYGVEVPKEDWSGSGQYGKVITTLSSGVTVGKNYIDGILEGETSYSFAHSEMIEKVETYKQGQLVKEVQNYLSGLPKKETQYTSPGTEVITYWYENSTPRAIENYDNGSITHAEYYNTAHQLEGQVDGGQGTRPSRDGYGLLISNDKIESGHMVSSVTYYPNSAPKEQIPYKNDLVEGQKKTFLPGGEPNTVEEWKAGIQEGLTQVFKNGEKVAEVPYVRNLKDGVEKRYRNGSTVVEEISWKAGQQQGPAYTYVEGSKITNWFYQGRQVNKASYDRLVNAR